MPDEPIQVELPVEEPSNIYEFDTPIVVGQSSPAQPLAEVAVVEYRGNDGNHIIRLPDGRVVAVPVVTGDIPGDIRAGLS
jgi:hypothetical protein